MNFHLIASPPLLAKENMRLDRELFSLYEKEEEESPTLRIYAWKGPSLSVGYGQEIESQVDLAKAQELGLEVVKRPTGGGMVFHNTHEVTFSLVSPLDHPLFSGKNIIDAYLVVSKLIVVALKRLNVKAQIVEKEKSSNNRETLCFSYPAEYEIVIQDKKIVGIAQRRGRQALLFQGSIFLSLTDKKFFDVLKGRFLEEKAVGLNQILKRKLTFDEVSKVLGDVFSEI